MPVPVPDKRHFETLDLEPDHAGLEEIRIAYKKLALKWHPDRHTVDKEEAQEKFVEINEAYKTLLSYFEHAKPKHSSRGTKSNSHPHPHFPWSSSTPSAASAQSSSTTSEKGEKDKKEQHKNATEKSGHSKTHRRTTEPQKTGDAPAHAHARDPPGRKRPPSSPGLQHDTETLFDDSDPLQPHTYSFKKAGVGLEDDDYELINLGIPLDPLDPPEATKGAAHLAKDWLFPLPLPLEDLYFGAAHRYRITRTLRTGRTQTVHISVAIPPGWRAGTRVRVPRVGNERRDGTFQDIVFVVEELPHARFVRVGGGADVEVRVQVPWAEAHAGGLGEDGEEAVYVQGIDGQEYALAIPRTLVEAADGTRVVGAGMPVRRGGRVVGKGDLIVRWEFVFPEGGKSPSARARWQGIMRTMRIRI